jgi:hypothetical protein
MKEQATEWSFDNHITGILLLNKLEIYIRLVRIGFTEVCFMFVEIRIKEAVMLHHVYWWLVTGVWQEHGTSIFKAR